MPKDLQWFQDRIGKQNTETLLLKFPPNNKLNNL